MPVAIEITIDDREYRSALRGLLQRGADLSPALLAIGQAMVTSTRLRFLAGVGPDGVAWKPSQRVLKHGGQTLILSRRLESSLMSNSSGTSVEWGSNVVYARIHQLGGVIKRAPRTHTIYRRAGREGIEPRFVKKSRSNFAQDVAVKAYNINMPARPFLGVNADEKSEITQILARHLAGGQKGGVA
jgi:phage virion morphogenesis protein